MTVLGSTHDGFRPIVGVYRADGAGAMQSLNPKIALFLAAVCASFLAGAHPVWWPYVIWGVVLGRGAWGVGRRASGWGEVAVGIDAAISAAATGLSKSGAMDRRLVWHHPRYSCGNLDYHR